MPETTITDPTKDTTKSLFPENYVFVMNINRLIGATSYNFDRRHELRRATINEITVIKDQLSKFAPPRQEYYTRFWEHEWPHTGGWQKYLSEPDWRYYVVSGLAGVSDLTDAFDLAPVELEVGFSAMYLNIGQTTPSVVINAGRFLHILYHFAIQQVTCK